MIFPSLCTSINCPFLISAQAASQEEHPCDQAPLPPLRQALAAAALHRCLAHGVVRALLMFVTQMGGESQKKLMETLTYTARFQTNSREDFSNWSG